jgi:enamine deaminase RidA (YjgF/YER057c/UK114 family)
VGDRVVITGRAGTEVPLEQAQLAAKVCTLRALALLQRSLGSLDKVRAVLKLNVYTQSAEHFTQQSEVADAASELLHAVLGPGAGAHARTSVGVYQLPKNATVELDLVAAVEG